MRELRPWSEDKEAQQWVADHPNGGTLDEVGQFFGLTRERIRQIETVALRKLKGGDFIAGRLRRHLDSLNERETGPRGRATGINRHALTMDELPSLGFDR